MPDGSPLRFKLKGASDSLDEAQDAKGGCTALTNLIFDPTTRNTVQCRPACIETAPFAEEFTTPSFVSVMLAVGSRVYGMIGVSGGVDKPFCWDNDAQTFIPITGAHFPTSPAQTGAWTPPTMVQIGGFVLVTHPGFDGVTYFFGWITLADFSLATTAYASFGSDLLVNVASVTDVSDGYNISGDAIPAGTTIVTVTPSAGPFPATGITQLASENLVCLTSLAGMANGQYITGAGIPNLTTVTSFVNAAGPFSATGTTTNGVGSSTITNFTDTLDAIIGQNIVGSGIPIDTTISSVTPGSSVNTTGSVGSAFNMIVNVANVAGVGVGNPVGDASGLIPAGTTVLLITTHAGPFTTTASAQTGSQILAGVGSLTGAAAGQFISASVIPPDTTILGTAAAATEITACQTFAGGFGILPNSPTGIAAFQSAVGTNIPGGAYVTGVTTATTNQTGCSWVNGATTITKAGAPASIVGQVINSPASLAGLPVLSVSGSTIQLGGPNSGGGSGTVQFGGNAVQLSQAATASASHNVTFSGDTIVISQTATGSGTGSIVFGGNTVEISNTATGSATAENITFTQPGSIGISKPATASASLVPLTFGGSKAVLSANMTASAQNISVTFGGSTITMSANATATEAGMNITIDSASLTWNAGNTGTTALPSIPACVSAFSGRAWFGVGNVAYYSDVNAPLTMSTGTQALNIGDMLPIIGFGQLPESTTNQGIIQALLAFKENIIWQVTGDIATSNLALNNLNVPTGTLAPRSIASSTAGVLFMATDGVRAINYTGQVTDPLDDIRNPFIQVNAGTPSRVSAAFNSGIYRICLQRPDLPGTPYQEWWFDTVKKAWNGPHSFRQDAATAIDNGFMLFNGSIPAALFTSLAQQQFDSTFIENGDQLQWEFETIPMADPGTTMKLAATVSTINIALPAASQIAIATAFDEQGNELSQVPILASGSLFAWTAADGSPFAWTQSGGATPGDPFLWFFGGGVLVYSPVQIPWDEPLVFNRLVVSVVGSAALGIKLGPLETEYEVLNYVQ